MKKNHPQSIKQVEFLDAEVVAIGGEKVDHLRPGEQPAGLGGSGARRHALGSAGKVRLIERRRLVGIDVAAGVGFRLIGHQRRRKVLVGDAEPAAGDVLPRHLVALLHVLVFVFLQPVAAEHADQALVQDPVAGHLWRADACDPSEGRDGHRRRAVVGDIVGHRDHVLVVDGDLACERQPGAVVIGQRHRRGGGQLGVGRRRPFGRRAGQGAGLGRADPAEFGEIGIRTAARRQEHDRRARRVDRLVIVAQADVVDAPAGQVDRAGYDSGIDRHALGLGQRLVAGLRRRLHACRARQRSGRLARGRRGGRRIGRRLVLRHLLGRFLLLAGPLDLRPGDEELPAEQDDHRQHDRQDEIAVVVSHRADLLRASGSREIAANPFSRSVTSRWN